MGKTRLELYNEVVRLTGQDPASARMTTTDVYGDINQALRTYATDMEWPWLQVSATFQTTSGVQTYPTPALWTKTVSLTITDGTWVYPLDEVQKRVLNKWGTATLVPQEYSIFGDTIYMGPVPDGAYTVTHDYIRMENTLTNDTDEVLCPDNYIEAITLTAAMIAAARIPDRSTFESLRNMKEEFLQRIRDNAIRTLSAPEIEIVGENTRG